MGWPGTRFPSTLNSSLIERRDAGKLVRSGRIDHARDCAQGVERAVDVLDEGFHVGGFAPGAADLKGQHVGWIEARRDAGDLLQAAQQQASADEQE